MAQIHKIIGPPGTGKTTNLIKLLRDSVNKFGGERVAAVSFTRAAAEEIKQRALGALGNSTFTPWVRTIHSACFKLLDLKKEDIAENKVEDFAKKYSYRMNGGRFNASRSLQGSPYGEEETSGNISPDEETFALMQRNRNALLPMHLWGSATRAMYRDWQQWTDEERLIDFPGMLEKVISFHLSPTIKTLYVDEAQDLAPLQLKVVESWGKSNLTIEHIVYVGDSDQAIYAWAGADPYYFLNLPLGENGKRIILSQSWRVPKKVQDKAIEIKRMMVESEDAEYKPREADGFAEEIRGYECESAIEEKIKFLLNTTTDDTIMILSRCNYQVLKWKEALLKAGILFYNPYRDDVRWNPFKLKLYRCLETIINLIMCDSMSLKPPSHDDIKELFSELPANVFNVRGSKKRFLESECVGSSNFKMSDLDKLDIKDEFLDMIIRYAVEQTSNDSKTVMPSNIFTSKKNIDKAEMLDNIKIGEKPRIILGTIHSVKGGEADHVLVDTDVSRRISRSLSGNDSKARDNELRVWYVAYTRAKSSLTILMRDGGFI